MDRTKEQKHQYYLEHREWFKRYYLENRERFLLYEQEHKLGRKKINAKSYQKLKQKVLAHYGNGKLACVRCGFNDIRALSIDHLNGGGSEQKRQLGGNGSLLYFWLVKHNYPLGYQTLCMNCQFIKRVENDEIKGSFLRNKVLPIQI